MFLLTYCSNIVPENWFGLELSPDSLNILQGGSTQELDKLKKLKWSIIVDHVQIVFNKVL